MDLNNIAVIYGSDSSEWEVSVRSGEFTASQIDGEKFDVYEIFARFGKWVVKAYRLKGQERVLIPEEERPEVCKTDFSAVVAGTKVKFDYAYIMQHGTPGENGLMQGYLEMLGVPHSGCNAFVSAITFDKFSCKSYLKDVDFVKCAKDIFLRKGESFEGLAEQAVAKLGLPMFVKPTDGGSSFGVTKVKAVEDFDAAVEVAFSEGQMLIAELEARDEVSEIIATEDCLEMTYYLENAPVTDDAGERLTTLFGLMGCNLEDVHILDADEEHDLATIVELNHHTLTEQGKRDWADVLGAKVTRIYDGYYGTQIEVTGCDPARLEAFSKMLAGECTIAESERWLNPASDDTTFELKYDDGGVQ